MTAFKSLLFFIFTFSATAATTRQPTCFEQVLAAQLRDPRPVGQNVAVVDIGSSTVKYRVRNGVNGEIVRDSFKLELSKSHASTGLIDETSYRKLRTILHAVEKKLKKLGVRPQDIDMVATAGIRDAKNAQEVIARLKRDGFKPRLLSEHEEAELIFQSIMAKTIIPPRGAIAIEVGGGSTEVVFGKGLNQIDHNQSLVIKQGSGTLNIKQPFDAKEIEGVSEKIRGLLRAESEPKSNIPYSNPDGYLSKNSIYSVLRDDHLLRTDADLFVTGLDDATLSYYLSQAGLSRIQKLAENPVHANIKSGLTGLSSKLAVVNEIKKHYGLPLIRIGSSGGMRNSLQAVVEAKHVDRVIQHAAADLSAEWSTQGVASLERLKFEVFSDIEFKMPGHWEHRGKGVASTQNELLKRWLAKDAQVADLQNANRAAVVVHDGVGARFTLHDATPEGSEHLHQQLLAAIRSGKLKIRKIDNHRAIEGVPYLSEKQVWELAYETRIATGRRPNVLTGETAAKKSGYTGLHLQLQDESGQLIGFQIRGKKVSELAQAEHVFFSIRSGKPVSHADPQVVARMNSLTLDQVADFEQYVADCYRYARSLELGKKPVAPLLPKSIARYHELSLY